MSGLNDVMYALPDRLSNVINMVDNAVRTDITEIRIRNSAPLILRIRSSNRLVDMKGRLIDRLNNDVVCCMQSEIEETFSRLCEHSLYSKQKMISKGYISMRSGCRAGICGCFTEGDCNLRQASSINIRIAHQIKNADKTVFEYMERRLMSVLIVGPPASGKTTVLRELCKRFSDLLYNTCILDERGEIAAVNNGLATFDVGHCTDIISLTPKIVSSRIALKMMNPDIIAFDELADDGEILKECSKCGAFVFATLHSDSIQSAIGRMKVLGIDASAFDLIVLLDRCDYRISQKLRTVRQ